MPDPVIPPPPNLPPGLSSVTSVEPPLPVIPSGSDKKEELPTGPVVPPATPVPAVTPQPPPTLQSQTPPPSNLPAGEAGAAGTLDVPPSAVDLSAIASAKADPTDLAGLAASLSDTPSTSVMPPEETISSPQIVPGEPEQKKKSGGKTSAIIGGLFLLILLPVLSFYVTQKTNVMSNLPFAVTGNNKRFTVERKGNYVVNEKGIKEAVRIGAPAPAVATGPQNSGVTHTCNGTSQKIGDFVIGNCPVSQDCTGSPYVYTVTADKASNLKLTYVTRSTHCSNVSIQIKVDGVVKKTTGFLGTSQSTGAIDLGTIAIGSHTIALGAIGQTGGCNAGRLASWGGSITTLCGKVAVTPTLTPTVTPTLTPTVTLTPTSTPTGTPVPTSPPSAPGVCDASCGVDGDCSSGFVCATIQGVKRCRKPECIDLFTCVCPAVTATPIPTSKVIAVVITATPTPIPTVITATPTPKVPVSGVPSVLGASTIVGGILLLLLGLLL